MLVKRTWEIRASKVDPPFERSLKVIFSPDSDGVGDFTLLVSTLYQRGGKTAMHDHPEHGELMYVTTGRGYAILGDQTIEVEPDTTFYAPPGVQHQVVNMGDETMKILCFFTPALPPEYIKNARDAALRASEEG